MAKNIVCEIIRIVFLAKFFHCGMSQHFIDVKDNVQPLFLGFEGYRGYIPGYNLSCNLQPNLINAKQQRIGTIYLNVEVGDPLIGE